MSAYVDDRDLAEQLKTEFRDYVQDRLGQVYTQLKSCAAGGVKPQETVRDILREAHSLKGSGSSFGFPVVTLVAQRLETYLAGLKDLDDRHLAALHIFADRIAEMAEREVQPDLQETNQIIRALPVRYEFDVTDVEVHDVDIMLVTPNKLVAKKVATELAACGFKVNYVADPIEAIGLAVRIPPDMVIAAAVMDGLGGIDLIRGLRAISVTEDVPMALLTSLDASSLKGVPAGTGIIRLGPSLQDDVAAAVTRFNIG